MPTNQFDINHVAVRKVNWNDEKDLLREIRNEVFVIEQAVPTSLEWDNMDEKSTHFLAIDSNGTGIGTVRLLPSGQIGRVAVRIGYRGHGIGRRLMLLAIQTARENSFMRIFLHAQSHAISLYEKLGFRTYGDEFQEAGIPHIAMELQLQVNKP